MQMKFFQQLANIRRHYDDIERQINNPKAGRGLLRSWNIDIDDESEIAQIRKEHAAITYLTDCRRGITKGTDSVKPDMDVLKAAFLRHLAFLDDVLGTNAENWRKADDLSRKEYQACRHYLFQLTLPAWVEKLPERIPTFENKYPDFDRPTNIPN